MSQQMIGPSLKLARLVLNMTQQQAGESIGLGPEAAKNVFALYERGARTPGEKRIPDLLSFIERASHIVEQNRRPVTNGVPRDAPAILDDLDLAALEELTQV